MADIIALDWDATHVCGVQADVAPGSLNVQKSFSFDIPEGFASPAELGPWLLTELQQNGISARRVLVSIPREDVVLRHLELPNVDDDELPELVRFQAASISTIPLDQLALDFLPLPSRDSIPGREVLMASVNRDRIETLRKTVLEANLTLESVGVSSIEAAHLVSETTDEQNSSPGELSLIVSRHGKRIELSILGQGHLYFSHSTQVASDDPRSQSAILAEISRSMIALQKRLPEARLARAWILGSPGEDSELAAGIHERFRCTLKRVDPFSAAGLTVDTEPGDNSHAAYAGPIGMLLGQRYESRRTLDFLHPRRAAVKRDYTQIKRMAVAAAGVLLIGSLFFYRNFQVSTLENKTQLATDQATRQKQILEELTPQLDVVDSVDEWAALNVNWLNETRWLVETMQGTDRHHLDQIRLTGGNRSRKGTVALTGFAKERADAQTLNAELLDRKDGQTVEVQSKSNNRSGRDQFRFEVEVTLKKDNTEF
ncbi:MAG: pilus assembly protein PilM [Planctomycetaceae bacterium]|jgi:Tfp pilus assembly PilM family ATPase